MTRTIRLEDVRNIPDLQATENGSGGWERVDLSAPELAIPPEPPAILGLLYKGRRHVISGPPESTKTLVAYSLLLTAIRAGSPVAILDFEMGANSARRMLDDLGATHNEIASIYYTEPDQPPAPGDIHELEDLGTQYVLIDAAAGAYDTTGLDDNARKDAETFARKWIRPLWQQGIASILVDHVTKDATTRGKFTIGSERKVGQADVHLSLDALKPLSRGHTGLVKVTVHKDRPGFLERPTAVVLELTSHPDTHAITVTTRAAHPTDEQGEFRPTALMEKVSRYLEGQTSPMSRNEVERGVKGKAEWVRTAIDQLVKEDHLTEEIGARGARLVLSITPFRKPPDDLVPTSSHLVPDEDKTTSSHLVPPLQGDEGSGRGQSDEETNSPRPNDDDLPLDVYSPAVQALLDDNDDLPL